LVDELAAATTRPWTLMEVCGGQTHAVLRWGLHQMLPAGLRLIHGPGCPVCVTAEATLDRALALARRPGVILCSYGDMLRVPASDGVSLLSLRSEGADVRLLTAAAQALAIARAEPHRQVVLLAVGFETTAPATALLARQALALAVPNLSLLTAHGRVAAAMEALLLGEAPSPLQGFLAAGHVCGVVGTGDLAALVARRRLPVVVTGFEPVDLLRGLLACVRQLEAGQARVGNAFTRVVRPKGNQAARALLAEVFEVVDQPWRGLGLIPAGGLALRPPYDRLDALRRFALEPGGAAAGGVGCPSCLGVAEGRSGGNPCIAAAILRGLALPPDCPAFAGACTPEHPLGAPMVSSEGACAAYQRHRHRSG
jgi:hydrogenase expression/formation protein HypD